MSHCTFSHICIHPMLICNHISYRNMSWIFNQSRSHINIQSNYVTFENEQIYLPLKITMKYFCVREKKKKSSVLKIFFEISKMCSEWKQNLHNRHFYCITFINNYKNTWKLKNDTFWKQVYIINVWLFKIWKH